MIVALTENLRLGGASTFLLNLAAGLRGSDHELRVISLAHPNEHREDFARTEVEVEQLDEASAIYEDRLLAAYQRLAVWKPTMVLACLGPGSFEILRLVPVGTVRVGMIQSDDSGPYQTAARYASSIDIIVGVSEEICVTLRGMPEFASKRVVCIPYGIAFSEAALRLPRIAGAPLQVVYVGRLLEPQKKISRIASLIEQLSADGTQVHFTIVGSGPEEAALRQRLARVPKVTWTGALPNSQISSILREQDVFILLSDYEGLPLSLLEAMGEGVVPVVSDLASGIRSAVTEATGLRVPVGDVEAAANALRMLAGDPQRTAALSRAASQHARLHFSARRMGDDFAALSATPAHPVVWPEHVEVPIPAGQRHQLWFIPILRPFRRIAKRFSRRRC